MRLTKAVNDWLNMEGDALDVNKDPVERNKKQLENFCSKVGIPYKTLSKYVHPDPEKRASYEIVEYIDRSYGNEEDIDELRDLLEFYDDEGQFEESKCSGQYLAAACLFALVPFRICHY